MSKMIDIPVGMPSGDVWLLKDIDPSSQWYGLKWRFDFSFIPQPLIKALAKRYVWEETREGNIVLSTAYNFLKRFITFVEFAKIQGYKTLLLSNTDVEMYKAYLATALSLKGTPYTIYSQMGKFLTLKVLIRFGQRNEMYHVVPRNEIFTGNDFRIKNKNLRIDYIPDHVVDQIMKALPNETNIYLKNGIRIMQGTGMRVGDLCLLKVGCTGIHPIDKAPTIRYFMHKTRKNKTVKVPAFVIQAIKEIEEYTSSFRGQASGDSKNNLFIYLRKKNQFGRKKGDVDTLRSQGFFVDLMTQFCCNHGIKDNNGEIYELTNHQFRRSLATDMLSKGMSLKTVSKQLGILPVTANKYYADIKDKELAAVFSGVVIGNVEKVDQKIIPNTEELEWFLENKHKGASMCDGYCMKPFKNNDEICERLKSKWACYKCNRYITTLEYLEFHKRNLAEIEDELEYNPYGEHYEAHLRPIAELIRQIVARLEGLKNDKEQEH